MIELWRQGHRTATWWVAAILGPGLLALDLYGQIHHHTVQGSTVLFFVAMTVAMATGLWVWAWRPQTHMGPLIFWWPALSVAADLVVPYPTDRLVTTIGLALYAWLLGAAAVLIWRVTRFDQAIGLALGAALLGLFVHALFYSGFFEDPITWLVPAIAAAYLVSREAPADQVETIAPSRNGGNVTLREIANQWRGRPAHPGSAGILACFLA